MIWRSLRKSKSALLFGLLLLMTLIEFFLRYQQNHVRWIDLKMSWIQAWMVSNELNHACSPKSPEGIYAFPAFYIQGSDVSVRKELVQIDKSVKTVLFLGDSTVQGSSMLVQIPYFAAEYLANKSRPPMPVRLVNAGCSSYSPSIYIPQFKRIAPNIAPDSVVLGIEESDVIDDTLRYAPLIERDSNNRILAVKPFPGQKATLEYAEFVRGFPLFILRPIFTQYFKSVLAPRYSKLDEFGDTSQLALSVFSSNLDVLFADLITYFKGTKKIFVVFHPRLHRLLNRSKLENWNEELPRFVKQKCHQYGIRFFDATEALKVRFGKTPENYYTGIHFNAEGYKVYAEEIAKQGLP